MKREREREREREKREGGRERGKGGGGRERERMGEREGGSERTHPNIVIANDHTSFCLLIIRYLWEKMGNGE